MSNRFPPFQGEPVTRAVGIAYVVFARPSIDESTRFLRDFGIDLLSSDASHAHYGSAGRGETFYVVRRETSPRFVGLAMYVGSELDLQRLVDAGLGERIERDAAPDGQPAVRMTDPNGFEVHAVLRRPSREANGSSRALTAPTPNTPTRTARVDEPFAPPSGVPRVSRLGHVVLETIDFYSAIAWYQQTFGMLVSDFQHLSDGTPVVAFCRCDRGDEPTDHHSIAIGQTFLVSCDHVAFEVDDIEAVTRGQHRMREVGWKHAWGIGRHIMGSQIFDYWYDGSGTKHEHYADGDQVTSTHPMGHSPFGPEYLAQWGPPMPSTFIGGKPSLKMIWELARCAASGDLSLPKLVTLIKAVKFPPKQPATGDHNGGDDAAR